MSDDQSDPIIDELKSLWRRTESPPADAAADVVDGETAAAIAALRAAWDRLEAPESRTMPPRRKLDLMRRAMAWTAVAAAAAWFVLSLRPSETRSGADDQANEVARGAPAPVDESTRGENATDISVLPRDDGLELRRGGVRLILLRSEADIQTSDQGDRR